MEAGELTHSVKTWRDRLAGRRPFDASAAEAAVRRAYRASALPEPRQVLWVKGPREAARAIAFLESPPRRLKRMALAAAVLGAVAWVGLALAIDSSTLTSEPPEAAAILSAALAGFGLALGGWRRLPMPPGEPADRRDAKLALPGAAVFFALAGYLFALQRLGGLPIDPVGRGAVLAVGALVGTLPGLFLRLRLRHAYAHLPRALLELSPSAPIGGRLERTREQAWAPFRRSAIGRRPDESLLEAYRSAHWEAFAREQVRLLDSDRLTHARRIASWDGSGWIAVDLSRNRHAEASGGVPAYLDGIEAASRATAASGTGATGSAAVFADLAFHVDRLYPFAAIAVAVEPATTVALDAEGRPHAEDGPALAWADGTRIFAWHGRLVPPDLLDRERPLTLARINREPDPGRRWVLIERYGLGCYLLEAGACEIHRDDCGRLYRLAQRPDEPIQAVRVTNHTPEPDGSFREFWLRVPPAMRTARQAVAWTFDLPAERYDPAAQS